MLSRGKEDVNNILCYKMTSVEGTSARDLPSSHEKLVRRDFPMIRYPGATSLGALALPVNNIWIMTTPGARQHLPS